MTFVSASKMTFTKPLLIFDLQTTSRVARVGWGPQ